MASVITVTLAHGGASNGDRPGTPGDRPSTPGSRQQDAEDAEDAALDDAIRRDGERIEGLRSKREAAVAEAGGSSRISTQPTLSLLLLLRWDY